MSGRNVFCLGVCVSTWICRRAFVQIICNLQRGQVASEQEIVCLWRPNVCHASYFCEVATVKLSLAPAKLNTFSFISLNFDHVVLNSLLAVIFTRLGLWNDKCRSTIFKNVKLMLDFPPNELPPGCALFLWRVRGSSVSYCCNYKWMQRSFPPSGSGYKSHNCFVCSYA